MAHFFLCCCSPLLTFSLCSCHLVYLRIMESNVMKCFEKADPRDSHPVWILFSLDYFTALPNHHNISHCHHHYHHPHIIVMMMWYVSRHSRPFVHNKSRKSFTNPVSENHYASPCFTYFPTTSWVSLLGTIIKVISTTFSLENSQWKYINV